MNNLRLRLTALLLRRRGKDAFVMALGRGAHLFDIGCGNDSPARVAALRSDLHYVGLDVGDYNLSETSKAKANEYIVCTPDAFAQTIRNYPGQVDAIVSAHNLEHCNDYTEVVNAMASVLAPQGSIYIAFPCRESVSFPRRAGTLNFYDDPTHRHLVDSAQVIAALESHGLKAEFVSQRYRPILLAALGLLLEPISWLTKRNMPLASTWALYGFETVIWARKV